LFDNLGNYLGSWRCISSLRGDGTEVVSDMSMGVGPGGAIVGIGISSGSNSAISGGPKPGTGGNSRIQHKATLPPLTDKSEVAWH